MNILATSSAFQTLPVVMRALMAAVAAWGGRGMVRSALTLLLYGRLAVLCGRMERLAGRFAAGRVWRRAPRAVAISDAATRRPRARTARVLPGGFGWLVRLAGYEAAGLGSQLRTVLSTPEMAALLAEVPQARRMLRPLCRMLAVETSVLRPAGNGAATMGVAPDGGAVRRVCATRSPVDWGRIPLPRGVLAAARRQGFVKSG